ncbi:unnamed protein product [Mytilus edulis]|uniref:Uncharacterized protein n=1 Tax=Mytilus edulis TaxID=6550 RepID=A0A8S3RHA5_MYTED|nr:unnamed protein product [Mytilus edulis]
MVPVISSDYIPQLRKLYKLEFCKHFEKERKRSVRNMDFGRTLISFLSLSFAWALASSIGSEFESSLTCSKFHFEEKVLEKLVRLEHTMQNVEEKMNMWENSITSKLDEMKIVKKQTETFVQSIQDAQLQEQTQFNKSYQDIVQQFKTQASNETVFYGDQMNTLLESLSSKIKLFTEAEEKRESVKELMHSTLHKEQKRLNSSYNKIVDLFKVNSNKALQELILKQEQGGNNRPAFTATLNTHP